MTVKNVLNLYMFTAYLWASAEIFIEVGVGGASPKQMPPIIKAKNTSMSSYEEGFPNKRKSRKKGPPNNEKKFPGERRALTLAPPPAGALFIARQSAISY